MTDVLRILMVDGAAPDRDSSAGERATFDLIDAIWNRGHALTFTTIGVNDDNERRVALLADYGLHLPAGHGGGSAHLLDLLRAEPWDAVIVHRPGPALAAIGALQQHPGPATLLWGSDIHTWRLQAQHEHGIPVPRHRRLVTEVSERRCWDFYDLSVYPTEREAEYLSARPESRGRGVAFPYFRLTETELTGPIDSPAGRSGCLMVGSSMHEPNRDAVEFAVTQVLPQLRQRDPASHLTVVGSWSAPARERLQRAGVRFLGRVSDDELTGLHQTHLCLLAPLRFGAGTRRKLVGAMGLGLPVITTSEGVRGLLVRDGTPEDGLLVADDAERAVAAVTALQEDPGLWRANAARARDAVQKTYGAAVFDAALDQLLDRAVRSGAMPTKASAGPA